MLGDKLIRTISSAQQENCLMMISNYAKQREYTIQFQKYKIEKADITPPKRKWTIAASNESSNRNFELAI